MQTWRFAILVAPILWSSACTAQAPSRVAAIEAYIQPYFDSLNFSGVVLVEQGQRVIFQRTYGFADRERQVANGNETRFHIASMSMQFTAAAILRLVDQGVVRLDDGVGEYVPGVEGSNKITVRDLLVEQSGLPDINSLSDYNEVLQAHQTPTSLVEKIQGRPLLFEPGTKFLHEEHSAYNVLALIIEKKSRLPFAEAMRRFVFGPAGLKQSGIDDDSNSVTSDMAKGYQPKGAYAIVPSVTIHWSGKAGNASAFTTANDELRWVHAVFGGQLLSKQARDAVLASSPRVGYGWFRGKSERFGEMAYSMNGRAPGFSSFMLHLPSRETTVIVLSNIYSSASTSMGNDIAAISLGLPHEPLRLGGDHATAKELERCTGSFRFGADFYQPNGVVRLSVENGELLLRWPRGGASPLIPLETDRFVDRAYWERVSVERDETGKATALAYGQFRGIATGSN